MSEGSSGGFSSFLRNSADKLSSKKGVKFLPPRTSSKDGETNEAKSKSQKEHRRAQVRKAQIEHRQRKENYIKHLEEDVIRLRDMISTAETEATGIRQENTAIKTTLSKSNIATNTIPSGNLQAPRQSVSPSDFTTCHPSQENLQANLDFLSPHHSSWPSNSSSSNVSMTFDDVIDASCLHVSAPGNFDNTISLNSPDIFNFPANTLAQFQPTTASNTSQGSQKPLPQLPGQGAASTSVQPDLSSIAINFILALEHPCRTHFHALPSEFDPTGDPTGHELMASTLLYSHAPEHVFDNLDSASWTVPSLELKTLWEMSQSLPKGDFEITPVQAWFLLRQNYEVGRVLGNLKELKRDVSKLVACWAFGAVMDELKFWDVVRGVMGE